MGRTLLEDSYLNNYARKGNIDKKRTFRHVVRELCFAARVQNMYDFLAPPGARAAPGGLTSDTSALMRHYIGVKIEHIMGP